MSTSLLGVKVTVTVTFRGSLELSESFVGFRVSGYPGNRYMFLYIYLLAVAVGVAFSFPLGLYLYC